MLRAKATTVGCSMAAMAGSWLVNASVCTGATQPACRQQGSQLVVSRAMRFPPAGLLAVAAWTGALMTLFFFTMKKIGMLRASVSSETHGLDKSKHGGPAYTMGSETNFCIGTARASSDHALSPRSDERLNAVFEPTAALPMINP